MKQSCLRVEAKLLNKRMNVSAKMICSLGMNKIPLLCNEGYLFVDSNEGELMLYVRKGK